MATRDLFGDDTVDIKGNAPLQSAANLILRLVSLNPELLQGERVGEIDRKIRMAAWLDTGLGTILSPEQIEQFAQWANDPKKCVDTELLRRARQYLVAHDNIRLSAAVIKDAEGQRRRLAHTFKA